MAVFSNGVTGMVFFQKRLDKGLVFWYTIVVMMREERMDIFLSVLSVVGFAAAILVWSWIVMS